MPHGQGVYTYGETSILKGEKYEGIQGEEKRISLKTFLNCFLSNIKGEYSNGIRHGVGNYFYANGDKYTGIKVTLFLKPK